MRGKLCAAIAVIGATVMIMPTLAADSTEWNKRCRRELGQRNDAETGKYLFSTPSGADGTAGRASMDYSVTGSRTSAIYPTTEKDFMSPWSGATINLGYFADFAAKPPYGTSLRIGQISAIVSAKDGKPLQGAITIKLVIDGKAFGPYEPKSSSLSSGQYSVWFDTAETDGDGKPPLLKPAEFSKLAKAVDVMKTAEMVLMRDKVDIVRLPLPIKLRDGWANDFKAWATAARSFVKKTGGCPSGADSVY